MLSFDYHPAESLGEALEVLGEYGDEAVPIAGGATLVPLMREGLVRPAHVVGLRRVPELRGIRRTPGGGVEIGACATHREIEGSAEVRAYCPALAEPFSRVATIRVRNQATIGGNLAYGDPAHDPPPMLLVLGAEAVVAARSGERAVPLEGFFADRFETALGDGEILTKVHLPTLPEGLRVSSLAFMPRTGGADGDYATVSVAAALRLDPDGVCEEARVGLGAVAPVPLRTGSVERALVGERLTPRVAREAAALAREEVDPTTDHRGSAAYKREMARVWTERALLGLLDRREVAA